MATILPNGTRVYTGPQPEAPIIEAATVDKEAVYGERPPRPTGTVCGNQELEPPVSYLVAKDGDEAVNEWLPADLVEAIPPGVEGETTAESAAA